MTGYLVRRLLLLVPVLLGVTCTVFVAMRVLPGDLAVVQLGEYATPEALQAFREEHGLNDPLGVQYFRWLGDLVQLDFGESMRSRGRPVLDEIVQRLPVTLELTAFAFSFALIVAIPSAIVAAVKQGTWVDYLARVLSMLGLATPSFVIGSLMVALPAIWFGWIPPIRYVPFTADPLGNLSQFVLPGIALGLILAGTLSRMLRSQLLEVLRQDYVRTARSKGLSERLVVLRHALKNAFIPVVTIMGLQVGVLMGGTIIIESIFSLPGIGRLMVESVSLRDYPTVQGIVVFMSIFYVLINLAVDVMYAWLDPRIRYA